MIQTLHQCNINHINNLDDYSDLISKNDALIIYGRSIPENLQQKLLKKFKDISVYFLLTENFNLSNIDYNDWVDLVQQSSKTMTWK